MRAKRAITFQYLKELNHEIKSNDTKRQIKAIRIANSIDTLELNPGLIMYIHYLKGKYHYLTFRNTDSLSSIEKSVECYRMVFQTARRHRVSPKNAKYFFKYAESLHKLSQKVYCLFEQNKLHNKAYLIAIHSAKRFPNNSSLKWLKRYILSN
jgi:hypothetical protein